MRFGVIFLAVGLLLLFGGTQLAFMLPSATSGTLSKELERDTETLISQGVALSEFYIRTSMDWNGRYWNVRRTYLTFDVDGAGVAGATLGFDFTVTHINSDVSTVVSVYEVNYGGTLEFDDWGIPKELVASFSWTGGVNAGHMEFAIPASAFGTEKTQLMIKTDERKPLGYAQPPYTGYDIYGFGTDLRLSDIKLDIAPISTPTPTTTTTPTPTPTSPILPTGSSNKQAIQIAGVVLTCLGLLLMVKRR